jgi:hypothetical protein
MKAQRAADHLKAINSYLAAFSANPYTIREHDDLERGLHIIQIILHDMEDGLPILIGEFSHSLRSALDHLAWQMGLLSGRVPSRSSCFPIHSSDSHKDRERFQRATWEIPCAAVEIIKSLQPCQRGKDFKSHPLWQLNKLSNLDKHVTIGYSGTVVQFKFATWDVPEPPWRSLDDSPTTEVMVPLAHKGKVKVIPEPPQFILGLPFDTPGPRFELPQHSLTEIERFVREDVLPKVAPFFPDE